METESETEQQQPPTAVVPTHSCWKCGKDGATRPMVHKGSGTTVYMHKQLRGFPGECDIF